MTISSKRRWRSSEDIALQYLEEKGYMVLERGVKVRLDGIEVGEVDAVVQDSSGVKYAVEVKAGNIDVNGIRQIYVNSKILGYQPLVVAKGYADESAEKLAEELGVKVYKLSDQFIIDAEEIETIVSTSIKKIIQEILDILTNAPTPKPEEQAFLTKLVESPTIKDLADKTNMSIPDVVKKIKTLQNRGLISDRIKNYQEIRLQAQIILLREKYRFLIDLLEKSFSK